MVTVTVTATVIRSVIGDGAFRHRRLSLDIELVRTCSNPVASRAMGRTRAPRARAWANAAANEVLAVLDAEARGWNVQGPRPAGSSIASSANETFRHRRDPARKMRKARSMTRPFRFIAYAASE
jgi:hypothetical protein